LLAHATILTQTRCAQAEKKILIELKSRNYIIIILVGLTLSSCYLFDSGSDKIIGNYKVLWIDIFSNQIICEADKENSTSCSQLIGEYVFAVGHNSNFIVAKQHPTNGFKNGYEVDTSVTNYFVIDINGKITKSGDKVIGPLSKKEFDKTVSELNIETIKFDQSYPENPN